VGTTPCVTYHYHLEPTPPIFIDLLNFHIYLSNIKIFLHAVWIKCCAEIGHMIHKLEYHWIFVVPLCGQECKLNM
jgi:hypothetical protein